MLNKKESVNQHIKITERLKNESTFLTNYPHEQSVNFSNQSRSTIFSFTWTSLLVMVLSLLLNTTISAQHVVKSRSYIKYHIAIKTAAQKYSGTDNHVRLEIFGDKGSTGAFYIQGSKIKGKTDNFTVLKKDVGNISRITVDVKFQLADKWRCESIAITKNASSTKSNSSDGYYKFNINYYFGKTAKSFTPNTRRHPVVSSSPVPTTKIKYLDKTNRGDGVFVYNYEQQIKNASLTPIEADKSQKPRIALTLGTSVGAYQDQRYVNIGTIGSKVAASTNGRLIYDDLVERGYYLEKAEVTIKCLTPGFRLPSYGPSTTGDEGSVTSSSGVNLQSGASLTSSDVGGSIDAGVNFGMSYSSDLQAFKAVDNSAPEDVTIKTNYVLSSTNVSETWSNPKGGSAPYTTAMDLIRMDAAGQFSGTPLNYLPALAKSNFPLATIGTFKAPNNYAGKVKFEVKIRLRLQYMKKDNDFFVVYGNSMPVDYTVTERFELDLSPTHNGPPKPYAENDAVQASNSNAIYLIQNGTRRHIPNPRTFFALGFNWSDVKRISVSVMNSIPLGPKMPSI